MLEHSAFKAGVLRHKIMIKTVMTNHANLL